MAIETEFKFQIDKGQKAAVLQGMRQSASETSDFETTYFDTPELDLRNRGMQLRLRRAGDAVIQTLKAKTRAAGPFGREEHELEVSDGNLNIAHVRSSLPRELRGEFDSWELAPQFVTRFRRVTAHVSHGAFLAEESYDAGTIVTDRGSAVISEVEIELKSGSLPAYSSACLEFLERVPAGLLLEGKAARGFRLARNAAPDPVYGIKEPLDGDALLPNAVLLLLRRHFTHFLDNHPAVVRGGAPGSIHQMRVGMRRLRAVLQSFSPVLDLTGARPLLNELRNLFARLGPVREADVFLNETLPEMREAGLREVQAKLLEGEIMRFREARYRELREAAASAEFARLVIRLNDWIEGRNWLACKTPLDRLLQTRQVRDFAAPRLQTLERKLMRKVRAARRGSLDDWHAARIAAKKLRYASTPLVGATLEPEAAAEYADRLSIVQDCLGGLNDLNTIPAFLDQVRAGVPAKARARFDAASEFCRGWSIGASADIIKEADRLLRAFDDMRARLGRGKAP